MYGGEITVKDVRKNCGTGAMGTGEQYFWMGTSSCETPDAEVIVRFTNLAEWLLVKCGGDRETVKKEVHQLMRDMEYQILELCGLITDEDWRRIGVARMQLPPKARNVPPDES